MGNESDMNALIEAYHKQQPSSLLEPDPELAKGSDGSRTPKAPHSDKEGTPTRVASVSPPPFQGHATTSALMEKNAARNTAYQRSTAN